MTGGDPLGGPIFALFIYCFFLHFQLVNSIFLVKWQVAAAKREPKQKKLSENVKKFLERREQEEKEQKRKEREKTKNLLELRQENKESIKAARRMLLMTKSANKAVVSEAINIRDTADTLAGRNQCDEDDYGYESSMAKKLYDNLMNKYEATHEDPMAKFMRPRDKERKDLGSTKSRVKERLKNGDPDPVSASGSLSTSGKRNEPDTKDNSSKKKDSGSPKPKPKSFAEIMAMAQQNKATGKSLGQDPSAASKAKKEIKEAEFERPMTAKEKREFLREKESTARKEGGERPPTSSSHASNRSGDTKPRISCQVGPKSAPKGDVSKSKPSTSSSSSSAKKPEKAQLPKAEKKAVPKKAPSPPPPPSRLGKLSQAQIDKLRGLNRAGPPPRSHSEQQTSSRGRQTVQRGDEVRHNYSHSPSPPHHAKSIKKSSNKKETKSTDSSDSKYLSSGRKGPRDFDSVESRPFPGEKRPRSFDEVEARAFPGERGYGSSSGAKKFKPSNMMKKPKGRMRIESDDEDYDSEMDDFIDDSEANIDIGAEIRSIFGYDRKKYVDEEDFDDREMENNKFSDLMKEEARSAKIGMMEDLEDMRREEEEKRRKKEKAKRRR